MATGRPLLILFIILAVLIAIPVVFFGLWMLASSGSDKGSPILAEEWRAELSKYDNPDEAKQQNPEIIVIRFDSGEWLIGLCRSSHGAWKRGGGTIVVKDSDGDVRAFFGHVCGEGHLGAIHEKRSLELYYRETFSSEWGFTEHKFQQ